jgi:hypothetical protein
MDAVPPSSGTRDRSKRGEWAADAVLEDETRQGILSDLLGGSDDEHS